MAVEQPLPLSRQVPAPAHRSSVWPGLVALTVKLGPKLLKLVKAVKVLKGGLALSSAASYAYLFTWPFAALIMAALFVHEWGHIKAMQRCGLSTKGIYFIPFIGGAAVSEELARRWKDLAIIALAGPIIGSAVAIPLIALYLVTGSPVWAWAAGWVVMVNAFNLMPINPLDGGRVLKSLTFSHSEFVGTLYLGGALAVLTGLAILTRSGLLSFLVFVATVEFWFTVGYHAWVARRRAKQRRERDEIRRRLERTLRRGGLNVVITVEAHDDDEDAAAVPGPLPMSRQEGLRILIAYLVLFASLFAVGAWLSHEPGAELAMSILRDDPPATGAGR